MSEKREKQTEKKTGKTVFAYQKKKKRRKKIEKAYREEGPRKLRLFNKTLLTLKDSVIKEKPLK